MTGKGSTRDFAELSKASARHLRAGLMVEYMRDLRQMSEILNLKVLLLEFYVMLNCGEAIPAIDRELVSSIRKAAVAVGASKYDVEELLLTMIHDDTTPRRSFTTRDSLYVLELCMSEEWDRAESIAVRFRKVLYL